ncbi:MAG: GNAT family N-acetyltransferase [Lachnospiraceae bacterium]|nr:GNAT family N-acetyltransferase [Lachnospiraceae bacterium]
MVKQIILALSSEVSKEEIRCFIQEKKSFIKKAEKKEELSAYAKEQALVITDREDFYEEALKSEIAFLVYLNSSDNSKSFPKAAYGITTLEGVEMKYLEQVYRRFHHLPWHILDTPRCRVREMTLKDLDDLYKIYEDPSITRYMEGLYEDREKEAAYTEDYIKSVYGFYGHGLWIVEEKLTGQIIGRAGISHREEYHEPELGYVIGKPYQNQGYATEVCKAIIQYGKEEIGFSHFNAFVHKENLPSVRICEKCGLVRKGTAEIGDEQLEWYFI